MYEVYLDDIFFYGVTAFQSPHDRKLVVYNGIGTGYFPKADDPNLKKWSWECTLQEFPEHYHKDGFVPASQIKASLDAILAEKEPVRLVMKSQYSSLSEQVLLESYQMKEEYAGVYSVSVNVTEYKEAAVRETQIPEIPRPGKVPQTPPHAVPEDETSYDQTNKAPDSFKPQRPPGKGPGPGSDTVIDPQTGNEVHLPVNPDPDKEYDWGNLPGPSTGPSPWEDSNKPLIDAIQSGASAAKDWDSNVWEGIKEAYKQTQESIDRVYGRK